MALPEPFALTFSFNIKSPSTKIRKSEESMKWNSSYYDMWVEINEFDPVYGGIKDSGEHY